MTTGQPILHAIAALVCTMAFTACEKNDPRVVQGYVEGEFVNVAAPADGQLESLSVDRGSEVRVGDKLFVLDSTPEKAARDEAARRVSQAMANLEDAKQGQRPTEIAALQAQLDEAIAAVTYSTGELERQVKLRASGAVSERDVDSAKSQQERDHQKVQQLTASLETARLGSRKEQIVAAQQALLAQEAALTGAEWKLTQKSQAAPVAGMVTDIVFRPGDWVKAGTPVVVLLPPANVKIRAFVPQMTVGRVHVGDTAQVHVDGVAQPYQGKVTYIAPRAEYTPPVIYSQKMREKFVFLVELSFTPDVAAQLHPGQPVDVTLNISAP